MFHIFIFYLDHKIHGELSCSFTLMIYIYNTSIIKPCIVAWKLTVYKLPPVDHVMCNIPPVDCVVPKFGISWLSSRLSVNDTSQNGPFRSIFDSKLGEIMSYWL